ncbi:MAG: DNA replication/repair protein RecF [Bacillota bacterium]
MIIKQLEFNNYTNYQQEKIEFDTSVNIITGENAQGKSNLIDGIFFLGNGRSHRQNRDLLLIKWGETYFRIKGEINNKKGNFLIEHAVKKEKKLIKVNGLSLDNLKQLLGLFSVIIFTPDDLNLIKEGPDYRRRFLNRKIVQLNPLFYEKLLNYQKNLLQRNNLLKRGSVSKGEVEIWNEQLSDVGSELILERIKTLLKLQPIYQEIHLELSGTREQLDLKYRSSFPLSENITKEELKELFQKKLHDRLKDDLRKGFTTIGPHRDDFNCYLNKIDARVYGSQGQQRTAVLTLKLAMLKLLKQETGEFPVLLLDDVFSELDQNRREFLLKAVGNSIQTIITTTDLSAFGRNKIKEAKIIHIKKGKIV